MIGRTIGSRYKVLEKLGEGGMGSVWKADDPVLRRAVAIKLLAASLWDSAEARERFLREARAGSQLKHNGIATVHEFGEVDGSPYIVFEFVQGRTFHQLLAPGPLPPTRAFELAAAAAEALSHAHAHGVLHRDVTANNLMLADDGRVVVVDFGLALPSGGTRVTRTAMSMGTVGYMAPEMFRGEPASERTDIYGLGAVLYRLLTGRLPFEAPTVEAMMYRMMNDPLERPSLVGRDVPAACDGPVTRALAREPAERWASAAEMAAALRATLAGLGSGAAPPGVLSGAVTVARRAGGTLARVAHRARRSRVLAGVAAGLAVALVVALGWAWREGLLPFGGEKVVAVLPVRVEGSEAADSDELGHIPDALGEELAARLGDLPGVRVLPWTTTRQYTTSKQPVERIARALHARYLVDGSLRQRDTLVHVALTIVDVARNQQVGNLVFDVEVADLFGLELSAALGVAKQLKGVLSAKERKRLAKAPSVNPEAYEYLVKGAHFLSSNDPATRALAEPYFRKALDLDRDYADAWVALGAIAGDRFFRGEPGGLQNLVTAERNYRHALESDPHNLKAVRGLELVLWHQGRAEEVLRVAKQAGPTESRSDEVLTTRGIAYLLCGAPDRAIPVLERARVLNPADQGAAWYLTVARCWSTDYDGCIQSGREFVKQFGEDPELLTWMGVSYTAKAMHREGRLCYQRAMELFGEGTNMYVVAYAAASEFAAGDTAAGRATAEHWLPTLRQRTLASPDNLRAQVVTMHLESLVGDTAGVRTRARRIIDSLQHPNAGGGDVDGGFVALCMIGDRELAVRYLGALRHIDLGTSMLLFEAGLRRMFMPSDSRSPESWPEFVRFGKDVEARRADLRRRY